MRPSASKTPVGDCITREISKIPSLCSDLKPEDKDRRILIEVWDWDRTSRNDFMGALSFGISEIIKNPTNGWFKLLTQEEGEYYNVPCADDQQDLLKLKQKPSQKKQPMMRCDTHTHSQSKKDMIRATDFNFIKVLGKGSFGKVSKRV